MSTTSGSCRRAYFSAVANDFVSVPTSRWLTMQPWCRWMNSIGSSTVMMWPFLAVDLVDHRRERGALARARRPGHQHQPARLLGQLRNNRRQLELVEGLHLKRDLPDHQRHAAALLEGVAPEPRQILDAEGEVEFVLGLEPLLLLLREDRIRQLQRVLRVQDVLDLAAGDVAVDPQLRALARRDVEVGRLALDHLLQQGAEVDRAGLRCRLG